MSGTDRIELQDLAAQQLPEFVRANYPTFVLFVEAYYEWLSSQEVDLTKLRDIDTTLDDYIQYFKRELAHNYPISANYETERFLLKHIKEQYLAKGSEVSYKLLFRLLYGKDVFIDYPGKQMLRVSDGRWQQDVSLYVYIYQGAPADIIGKTVTVQTSQKIYNTDVVEDVEVSSDTVQVTVENAIETEIPGIWEILVNRNFFGEILPGDSVKYESTFSGLIVPVTAKVQILEGGADFAPGQVFAISSGEGTAFWFKVSEVFDSGALKKIDVIKFGLSYTTDFSVTVLPTSAVSTRQIKTDKAEVTTSYSKVGGLLVDGLVATTGFGYTLPPLVTINASEGNGADLETIINDGVVSQIQITNPGSGYLIAPTVTITGDGTPVEAHSIINEDGEVTDVVITTFGYNYTNASVTFTNAGSDTQGSGATGTVSLVDGGVTGFTVNDTGIGYTGTVFLQINNAPGDVSGIGASADPIIGSDYDYSFIDELPGFTENGYLNWGDVWELSGDPDRTYSDGAYCGTIARQFFINSSDTKEGDPAVLNVELGAVGRYPGYYKTNDGFLDDSMFIQDSYYYQAFAYVLKIDEQLEAYASVVRSMLHPSGMAMFGEYSINNTIDVRIALEAYVKSLGVTFYDTIVMDDTSLRTFWFTKDLSDTPLPSELLEIIETSKYLEDSFNPGHLATDVTHETTKAFGTYDHAVSTDLWPSEEFYDQMFAVVFYSGNFFFGPDSDFETWANSTASDGYAYGDITADGSIGSTDLLGWTQLYGLKSGANASYINRWQNIVLPSLMQQTWFDPYH